MATNIKVTVTAPPNAQTGTTYTFALGDEVTGVTLNNAGAIAAVVPNNTTVAFPVGVSIPFFQIGAGQVTVSGESGVTVTQIDSKFKLRGQWAPATLYQRSANNWILWGDLSA